MTIDRIVFAVAGSLVLLGLLLGYYLSPYAYWIPAFVGANQLQAAFTGFCPLARILKHFGAQPGPAF